MNNLLAHDGYAAEAMSYREACCKTKDPEKPKEIVICREQARYREASMERISSEEGKLLRVNCSIPVYRERSEN